MIRLNHYHNLVLVFFILGFVGFSSQAQKRICVKLEGIEADCSGGGAGVPGTIPTATPAGASCDDPACKAQKDATCSNRTFECTTKGKTITCGGGRCGTDCGTFCQCYTYTISSFVGFTSKYVCDTAEEFGCGAATKVPAPDSFCNCTCVKSGSSSCTATNTAGCASCDCSNSGYTTCKSGTHEVRTCDPRPTTCKRRDAVTIPGTLNGCACSCPPPPSYPDCGTSC